MSLEVTAAELAVRLDGTLVGPDRKVHHLAAPAGADATAVVVLTGAPAAQRALLAGPASAAAVVVLQAATAATIVDTEASAAAIARPDQAIISVSDTRLALATLSALFDVRPALFPQGIHPTAVLGTGVDVAADVSVGPYSVVGEGTVIGPGARIGPHVSVGPSCFIAAGCTLHAGVRLYDGVVLGARVELHSGCVLGADGFGYASGAAGAVKIHQLGNVVIAEDVEIGANTCIDRGTLGATSIGPRSKIDNHCQVGHNVTIGSDCVIAGMTGIAGSTRLGDRVTLGGYVAVADHLSLGDDVRVAGRSGVTKDVPAGETWAGFPAQPYRSWVRSLYLAGRLERIWQAFRADAGDRA